LSGAITKLASITFSSLAFSYWIDNLGFLLREKLAAIFIIPSSWGSQLAGHFTAPSIAISDKWIDASSQHWCYLFCAYFCHGA
jgi:hypothetical protein